MTETTSKVRGLIRRNVLSTKDSAKVENDNAGLHDDLGYDSLDKIELAMAIEQEFDIELTDDEINKIVTVGDTIALVESKISVPSVA